MTSQLSLEKTNLSLVKRDELKNVLNIFEIEVEKNEDDDEEIIFLTNGDLINRISAKCSGCGIEMNLNNFGHLAKGSKLVYCKNPLCFNHYLAIKKIKEVKDD